ncbi:MAG: DUF2070 family protein [Sulfolobaceae archaeon]
MRRYYSNIIKLPNERILIFTTLLIIFLTFLENNLSRLFFAEAIYFSIIFLLFIDRRKLGLFFITISGAASLLFNLLNFAIYALIFFTPLYTFNLLTKYSEIRAVLLSSLPSDSLVILYPYPYYIVYLFTVILTSYFYLLLINRRGKKTVGISSLQIARPFLREILHKDENPLEHFLERLSYTTSIHVGVFKFGDLPIIIPKIHFGIFGRIGSSMFIYDIEDKVKGAMVFHGPGSHELDLPSRRESKRIISEIVDKLNISKPTYLRLYSIKIQRISNFTVTSLVFDKALISFIERENGGIDDLPQGLWELARKSNIYVIDTHSLSKEKDINVDEIKELKAELKKLLSSSINIQSTENKLLLGYAEDFLNRDYAGYCNKRIRVLILGDGERKVGIVYIYANNANPELYYSIKKETKDLVDYTILVTPDDHSCTGISFGYLYTPATYNEEIIMKVREMIRRALNELKPVNVEFYPVEVKGVKVLGSIVSVFVHGLENVGKYVLKTFWIPFLCPILFMIIIMTLRIPL